MASQKDKILKGFAWTFAERISSQGISFVLQIFLARLLMPEQYGMIAMINVFMVFASVFVTIGFSSSLIQKKDSDDLDFSTIFYCSFSVSLVVYIILYFSAPLISIFYHMPGLTDITRVYALTLILSSYNSIQRAYVSRNMIFKKFFISSTIGIVSSGIIGIVMAYMGLGVWALVGQSLGSVIFNILTLHFVVPWRPKLIFSFQRAKSLMSYGANILGAQLMGTFFDELRQLLIGRYYTAADLSFYNRGKTFPFLISKNINSVITSVLFPAMSNNSDNPEAIKSMTRKAIKTSSYLMFFALSLMAVASKPLVILLLTEKWAPAIPYMQVICISQMIAIMSTANMQALKASGRSDVLFKLEFIKKPVFLIFVIIAVNISVMAVAITMPLYSLYAAYTNMKPNKDVLGYSMKEQLKDLRPAFLLTLAMVSVTVPFLLIEMNEYLRLSIQLILGTITYFGLSHLFKVNTYFYCKNLILEKINK